MIIKPRQAPKAPSLKPVIGLVILLAATFLCFLPGLSSNFIFDDFPNLDALTHIQGESIFSPAFWEFVLGGQAGPSGRPVSLFTFALQAGSWPDNPAAFKLVNLLIHCLNAALVYLVCRQLSSLLGIEQGFSGLFCLLVSLAWAIHPIHNTVVLYAVQRMALLANCFILLGIYCHLRLRLADFSGRETRRLLWLTISLATWGLLALFSKENAPSLVFYLLVLEYTLLRQSQASALYTRWRLGFLWLPVVSALLLALVFLGNIQDDFRALFDFTVLDRLLTESRILWQYLGVILAPSTGGTSLFHDVGASTSLLSPLSTLLAVAAWAALLALAFLKPGRHGIFLFAILWYFSGHIVESTILPLELYFNHRNYLAFLGPLLALLYALFMLLQNPSFSPRMKTGICSLYILILAIQSLSISSLWRDPLALAENWYAADPLTARNAEFYAISLAERDMEGMVLAAGLYDEAYERDPGNFRLMLNRMTLACATSFISPVGDDLVIDALDNRDRQNRDLLSPMQQLVMLTTSGECALYSPVLLSRILTELAAGAEPMSAGQYQVELARLSVYTDADDAAISYLESAYANTGDAGVLFTLALRLINLSRLDEALAVIDQAIEGLQETNDIRTGTRESKLSLLYEMRGDVLGFMESQNQ